MVEEALRVLHPDDVLCAFFDGVGLREVGQDYVRVREFFAEILRDYAEFEDVRRQVEIGKAIHVPFDLV